MYVLRKTLRTMLGEHSKVNKGFCVGYLWIGRPEMVRQRVRFQKLKDPRAERKGALRTNNRGCGIKSACLYLKRKREAASLADSQEEASWSRRTWIYSRRERSE